MTKFVFDMNQISFTEKGEKIIAYFDEYLNASEIVKDAIKKALSFEVGSAKFLKWFDECKTHDEFCEKLAEVKSLLKKDCKDTRMTLAKEFVNNYAPTEDFPFSLKQGKTLETIIISKRVGFKSTTLPDAFDFKARSCKTDAGNFSMYGNFIENFLNFYVRKKIVEFLSEKDTKDCEVNVSYAEKNNHWIDLSIDFSIKISNLSDELCKKVFDIIADIDTTKFW